MADSGTPDFDLLIVGAGVLGVTLAYWLSELYDCTVGIVEASQAAGMHTTSRNTGVIHRPFYLDPRKKRVFARTSDASLPMWRRLAEDAMLPWKQVGTINVALGEDEVGTLRTYHSWGIENGMREDELELFDGREVARLEPEVRCIAGLMSRTDVSVDFGAFTRHLCKVLTAHGVRFLGGRRVSSVRSSGDVILVGLSTESDMRSVSCRYLVNAAGGGALRIAHNCGLAREYGALNFRGEYWVVDEPFASSVTSNIYRPPRFPRFPFLDPHFVVRADGSRQIGPNAVMVAGPYVYSGVGIAEAASLLEGPIAPKAKLLLNPDFISLLAGEWRSSLSKRAMCARVRRFVPDLDPRMLNRRAVFGVRTSVVDSSGFVPEAVLLKGEGSAHIINYNSPGATGAPSYSAKVVDDLRRGGLLDRFRPRRRTPLVPGWDFEAAVNADEEGR